jgi:hypothetical protein
MSRSFKHNPIVKYCGDKALGKHLANKRTRKIDLSDGNNYKKAYEQYDIWDVRDNLYCCKKIDGIPAMYKGRKMSINEIDKYWRK